MGVDHALKVTGNASIDTCATDTRCVTINTIVSKNGKC